MFGITKSEPACLGCGETEVKLCQTGHCAACAWAISQRHHLEGQRMENEIKSEALQHLDKQVEKAWAESEVAKQAYILEGKILLERNADMRAKLIKACRKIKALEAVPDTTDATPTEKEDDT